MSDALEVHIKVGQETHRVGTLYQHFRGASEASSFSFNVFPHLKEGDFYIRPRRARPDEVLGSSGPQPVPSPKAAFRP